MRFCKASFRFPGSRRSSRQHLAATGLEGDLATIDAVFAVDQRARQQAHDLLAKRSVFKN